MYLARLKRYQPTLNFYVHADRRPRAQAGGRRRPRDQGRQISRPAARAAVGREGSVRDQGHQDDVGRRAVRGSGHRLRRHDRRAAARRRRGARRQAHARRARAGRPLVRRPDAAIRGIRRRGSSGSSAGPGSATAAGCVGVRDRHRDPRLDPLAVVGQRRRRTAADVRPRQPLRRDGALDDDGQDRSAVPVRRGRGARAQRDLRSRQARRQRRRRRVSLESGHAARRVEDRLREDGVRQCRRPRRRTGRRRWGWSPGWRSGRGRRGRGWRRCGGRRGRSGAGRGRDRS